MRVNQIIAPSPRITALVDFALLQFSTDQRHETCSDDEVLFTYRFSKYRYL